MRNTGRGDGCRRLHRQRIRKRRRKERRRTRSGERRIGKRGKKWRKEEIVGSGCGLCEKAGDLLDANAMQMRCK